MLEFIKKHWLVIILVTIIVFLAQNRTITPPYSAQPLAEIASDQGGSIATKSLLGAPSAISLPYRQTAPADSPNRLTIVDTYLSLVVKNVPQTITQIETIAKNLGGFLVNSYLSKPQEGASGTIVVRVPEDKRSEALTAFRQTAAKIVSESISGTDVTDQYTDLDAQLTVLNKTKAKFEDILARAITINDLLNVQRELINLQSQIDSVVGQQKYLSQSAKLTKITIYLSTDELSLPYTPDNNWRPTVIFKQAVRSLTTTFRQFVNLLIWIIVYLPVWAPILLILFYLRKRRFPLLRK